MDQFLIFGAAYLFLVIIAVGAVAFFFSRFKKKLLLLAAVSLPLSYILAKILGYFVISPRPAFADHVMPLISVASDNGFPSDHTLLSMTIALIVFAYHKKIGALLIFLATVVGVCRVLVHAHHWIDVVGSVGISIAAVGGVYFIQQLYEKRTHLTRHKR